MQNSFSNREQSQSLHDKFIVTSRFKELLTSRLIIHFSYLKKCHVILFLQKKIKHTVCYK